MPRHAVPIAITLSDFGAYGCAYCGHTEGRPAKIDDDVLLWQCGRSHCGGRAVVVEDDLEESPYTFEGTRPKVQEHPLKQPPQKPKDEQAA